MPSFDFISAAELRASLETDYRELHAALEAKAWKSVQVIAGSIVEAVLVDYILATANASRSQKDPLKYDLAEAISTCRGEKAITEPTADLCSVVRSYRNLIHPGRAVRIGEAQPSENSARIAVSVVDLILDEIAGVRRKTLGLTAEQLASKIERDPSSLTILKHLLAETSVPQLERFLLEALPSAYFRIERTDDPFESPTPVLRRLSRAYRLAVQSAPESVKRSASAKFVQVLREEDGEVVSTYSTAFFAPSDLKFVETGYQEMVRHHLLSRIPSVHDSASIDTAAGLVAYLKPDEIPQWLDPFIRALISSATKPALRNKIHQHVAQEAFAETTPELDAAIDSRLKDWERHFKEGSNEKQLKLLEALKSDVESNRLPF
jgi:hypothetical protein